MPEGGKRMIAFLTAIGVFVLDRASKWQVETRVGAYDSIPAIPGFLNIVKSQNPGVAFGIFSEATSHHRTPVLVAVSILAVIILAGMLWRIERQDRPTAIGLSLVFGGALGNVFDRVSRGTVTDFLDVYFGSYHWYTFNLADTAICIGAGCMILSIWNSRKESAT